MTNRDVHLALLERCPARALHYRDLKQHLAEITGQKSPLSLAESVRRLSVLKALRVKADGSVLLARPLEA